MDGLIEGLGILIVFCSAAVGAKRAYAGASGIAAATRFTGLVCVLFLVFVFLMSIANPANMMLIAFMPVGVLVLFFSGLVGALFGSLIAPRRG
jgi:uncharacterized membrane protein